jgi:hypothetical protein
LRSLRARGTGSIGAEHAGAGAEHATGPGVAVRHRPRVEARRRGGPVMPGVENDRIIESTTEARQGETGHGVRYVLGVGVVAVIVAFAIVYLVYLVYFA